MSAVWATLDEHRQYLSDARRLAAFEAALGEVIRPTDVVLDLGCGTGVLGLLASRAGAKHVYSVDASDMIQLARDVGRANALERPITYVRGRTTDIDLPELVDVVVADQLGGLAVEGGIFDCYRDARERLLASGGRFIPSAITLAVAPLEAPAVYATIDTWGKSRHGLSFAPIRHSAANILHPCTILPVDLLAPALATGWIDPSTHVGMISIQGSSTATRDGVIHGLGGWFTARLSERTCISNGPVDSVRIDRHNTFLPLERPLPVAAGDRVEIDVRIEPTAVVLIWEVRVVYADGRIEGARQSTLEGTMLTRDTLALTRPSSSPILNVRLQAERDALVLCDGTHSVADIEGLLLQRYPSLFPTPARAAGFVARRLKDLAQ